MHPGNHNVPDLGALVSKQSINCLIAGCKEVFTFNQTEKFEEIERVLSEHIASHPVTDWVSELQALRKFANGILGAVVDAGLVEVESILGQSDLPPGN